MGRTTLHVLDHGYVKFIEKWGGGEVGIDEGGIIEAARQSTQGSFRGWERDEALLRFLWTHKHSTPFEFAGLVIEVQAPIFVFREWHRHRTQSYNEMSARYAPLPDLHYVPTVERLMMSGGLNKQASGMGTTLTEEAAEAFREKLQAAYVQDQELYEWSLDVGIPKELARSGLAVGRYSRMRACTDLRNWLGFLTLRMAPDAQWEIRQYANAVGELISEHCPKTWSLFSAT